jgi:hypothetical protein
MKKLLMSSVVLLIFATSITLFQVSCSKSKAAPVQANAQLGKILYSITSSSGHLEFWTSNYDGTNQTLINITLPTGVSIDSDLTGHINPKLSPDGTKIFFTAVDSSFPIPRGIYIADINGTNVNRIISAPTGTTIFDIQGAY